MDASLDEGPLPDLGRVDDVLMMSPPSTPPPPPSHGAFACGEDGMMYERPSLLPSFFLEDAPPSPLSMQSGGCQEDAYGLAFDTLVQMDDSVDCLTQTPFYMQAQALPYFEAHSAVRRGSMGGAFGNDALLDAHLRAQAQAQAHMSVVSELKRRNSGGSSGSMPSGADAARAMDAVQRAARHRAQVHSHLCGVQRTTFPHRNIKERVHAHEPVQVKREALSQLLSVVDMGNLPPRNIRATVRARGVVQNGGHAPTEPLRTHILQRDAGAVTQRRQSQPRARPAAQPRSRQKRPRKFLFTEYKPRRRAISAAEKQARASARRRSSSKSQFLEFVREERRRQDTRISKMYLAEKRGSDRA